MTQPQNPQLTGYGLWFRIPAGEAIPAELDLPDGESVATHTLDDGARLCYRGKMGLAIARAAARGEIAEADLLDDTQAAALLPTPAEPGR